MEGRSEFYPGMFGGIDPNLSESDRIMLQSADSFKLRREVRLAALSPERVIVQSDESERGHLSLFRRVTQFLKPKLLYATALEHLPTISRMII